MDPLGPKNTAYTPANDAAANAERNKKIRVSNKKPPLAPRPSTPTRVRFRTASGSTAAGTDL